MISSLSSGKAIGDRRLDPQHHDLELWCVATLLECDAAAAHRIVHVSAIGLWQ
jgi:hypothetical protein